MFSFIPIFVRIVPSISKSIGKSILTHAPEKWPIKQKHRHKLLATKMDYLNSSGRISRMDRLEMNFYV
jgi:hypothetical protein